MHRVHGSSPSPAVSLLGFASLALAFTLGFPVLAASPAPPRAQPSHAQTLSDRATGRIAALAREAETLARQERSLIGDLRRLEVEHALKVEQSRQLAAERASVERQIADAGRQIAELDRQVQAQAPALAARLAELYKLGRPGYARLLLDVKDLRDTARSYRMVSALARLDRERVEERRQAIARITTERARLRQREVQLARLREDAERARLAADRAVKARAALIAEIDSRRDLNARLIGELQAAHAKLQDTMARLGPAATEASEIVLPLQPFRGDLDWPVKGRLAARFGQAGRAARALAGLRRGIVIAAAEGTSVHAVHEGRVAYADAFQGFGNLVIVDHGGQCYSLYGYLASMGVERGAHVGRGDAVGTVGAQPAGDPGLYFELRIDGNPVDPVQWLKPR